MATVLKNNNRDEALKHKRQTGKKMNYSRDKKDIIKDNQKLE